MPDIEGPQQLPPTGWDKHGDRGWKQGSRHPYAGASRPAAHHVDPADAISILGIDPREFTPEVQGAIATLMTEVDRLREQVHQLQSRQKYLEDLADSDDALPVLNRRAFLRAIRQYLQHQKDLLREQEFTPPGALILLYLVNFEDLHRRFGLTGAMEGLQVLADRLAGAVRSSDVVGAVGGPGVAALLPGADEEGAAAKLDELLRAVDGREVQLAQSAERLSVRGALQAVRPDDDAEGLLAQVDAELRERLGWTRALG